MRTVDIPNIQAEVDSRSCIINFHLEMSAFVGLCFDKGEAITHDRLLESLKQNFLDVFHLTPFEDIVETITITDVERA